MNDDLPPLPKGSPPGTAWKRADEIEVGNRIWAREVGVVVGIDLKPKTVWLTIRAEDPRYFGATVVSRPRHDDYLPVIG